MSTKAKRNLALAALVGLALWPAIHFGLYRAYAIEPWKLCGWAMYARPRSSQHVLLMDRNDERLGPIRRISPRAQNELTQLMERRGALGALQPMDSLARILLSERTTTSGLRITVRTTGFDCGTGRIEVLGDRDYDYDRAENGDVVLRP